MCQSMGGSTGGGRTNRQGVIRPIRFGKYNDDRNGELESGLRGMFQANMDLGVFQETKP